MQNKNCVVLLTHIITDRYYNYLLRLKSKIDSLMDFYIIYDESNNKLNNNYESNLNIYKFKGIELKNFIFTHNIINQPNLYNTLIVLIEFSKKHKYEHYLFLENDIILKGDFSRFINIINNEECDYIHIATDIEGGPNNHWPIKLIQNNTFNKLYFAWAHMFYISKNYLNDLNDFIQINNTFFQEFLLPTYAYNSHKYVINQFENFGYRFEVSWGPCKNYEKKFLFGDVNTFYHPIKNDKLI